MAGRDDEARAWRRYAREFRENALGKIAGAGSCILSYPRNIEDIDVRQATELGALLLLDKPLILLTMPGSRPPDRLLRLADEVIEIEDADDPTLPGRLVAAARRLAGEAQETEQAKERER